MEDVASGGGMDDLIEVDIDLVQFLVLGAMVTKRITGQGLPLVSELRWDTYWPCESRACSPRIVCLDKREIGGRGSDGDGEGIPE